MAQGGDRTKKGELTERVNTAKGLRADKRRTQDQMRDIVEEIKSLEDEKRNLLKQMHSRCHTVEEVTAEIKSSERRLTTTSMTSQAEAQLIKEIEVLKQSVPKAKRYS